MEYNLEVKEFLAKQIELPQEKWDSRFRRYIEESYMPNDAEDLISGINEKSFIRYLRMLDIKKDYLNNKIILDLGCGEEAEFVKYCLDNNIGKEIYGLDVLVKPKEVEERYRGHILKGNYSKKLPLEEVDLIISVGAVFPTHKIKKPIINAIKALKIGGEIRIAPIWHTFPGSKNIGIIESREKLEDILIKLEKKYHIKWQMEPVEIRVPESFKEGSYDDIWLNEVLIIKK
ncbi:MAG: class I SAM-dependent methyltransferase [Candidatus Pacebacteria bacterium]|nr:class I SAM-dependent methyltransferase [Candidatus Paceibacterota bacterium]